MKRIFLTILIIFTLLLSACGKETKTKEPQKELSTTIVETNNIEETTSNFKKEPFIEKEELMEENIIIENDNDLLSIGQSYEIMNNTGILYLYDNENNEYAIICDESEIKYFVELSNNIFIKPELEDAGDVLYEMKKEGYIMTSLVLSKQNDLIEIMKKYGYEGTSFDVTNIKEEDYNKILEELISSLSQEELLSIESSIKEILGTTKAYYLKSFEIFDKDNKSLNINSIKELKEYYDSLINEELNKYKEFLRIEEMEELVITNDDILISNLEEGKVYYYDKRTNVVNDSDKVLKVKTMNLEKNEEDEIIGISINENYYSQITSSSIKTFGQYGPECFYLWSTESKIELFTFDFIENENEINTLLEEDSLFEGFKISTIKENEIITFEGDATTNLFNDLDKTIEIFAKDNLIGENVKYPLEPNEVIKLWTSDLENVYWTYKE